MGCQSSRETGPKQTGSKFDHTVLVFHSSGAPTSKYLIDRILGKGSFGTVMLVENKISRKKRALKELQKCGLTYEDRENMLREVKILSKVDHPNIMQIYEVIESDTSYNIITELISGGELFDKICRDQKLSERQAAKYMLDIMSALSYCHEMGIVHRDLKPQNVLLTSEDPNAGLKVIDFGLSGYKTTNKKFTQMMGTPLFMSPEVFNGSYDEKCDIWSAGIILFMMITGMVPFYGKDISQIRSAVLTQRLDYSKPIWEGISGECKDLVQKMIEKNPSKRLSAKEVLQHSWIRRYQNKNLSDLPISKDSLENLAKFNAEDKVKRTIFTFIARDMMDEELSKELTRLFKAIDKNNDGSLSYEEIENAYEHLGMTLINAQALFRELDGNNSGLVDYSEFVTACLKEKCINDREYLEQAFKAYDIGGDGNLSITELRLGVPGIDSTRWSSFISKADKDNDGKINFSEFREYLQQSS